MTGLADALPNDVETLKAMLLAERARGERLAQIIKELQRHRFGRRAETLPVDQLELGLEDVQQAEAADAAETEKADPPPAPRRPGDGAPTAARCRRTCPASRWWSTSRARSARVARASCTASARVSHVAPSVRATMANAERLDIIPAQLRVLVTRRPKYACRACEEA